MAEKKKVNINTQEPVNKPTKPSTTGTTSISDDKRLMSALAYILHVLGIIIYFLEKEDKKVRFDALQSTIYNGASLAIFLLLSLLTMVLSFVFPLIGCIGLIWVLLFLGTVIYSWYMAYKVYQGERVELPMIADFVKKHI